MSDRRIAFLARDLVWKDTSGGVLPFSYAARKLEASLKTAPDLSDVESTVIDLRTDDPEAFFERIRAFRPSVIGASTYIWSAKVFCQVAEMVRKWDPSVRFVMGGPAARPSLLSLSPYAPYLGNVDAVVTGEGEEVVRRIARAHDSPDWTREVPGLSVPGPLGWRTTAPADRPVLDDYASPYQLGTVPRAPVGFLETYRGCPISCAFCQWGEEKADRAHSAEYLAGHLRGMRKAGVERVYVVDAAFNLSARAFRSLVQAEHEVGALKSCQVIGHLYPTYINDDLIALFSEFRRTELAVGVQSFDERVLKNLGRPFDVARMERVLRELRGRFDVDFELILGLPGDDPASFRRSFERAIELSSKVRVFYCLALPDALIERAEKLHIDFDPDTFEVRSCDGWSPESLRAEWDHVLEVAEKHYRPVVGPNWIEFRTAPPAPFPGHVGDTTEIAPEVVERLRRAVDATEMGWRLSQARAEGDRLLLALDSPDGSAGPLVLEAMRASDGSPYFSRHDRVSYSHRGRLAPADAQRLRRFIERVHGNVRPVVSDLAVRTREAP